MASQQDLTVERLAERPVARLRAGPKPRHLIMAVLIITFGFYILYPVILVFVNSFNIAGIGQPTEWSLDNWRVAFSQPGIWTAVWNTFMIYFLYTGIGFPAAVLIAWTLARTNVKWSYGIEFMFWVSFMMPGIATTVGWALLLDPYRGMLNQAVVLLPFISEHPFNIYSIEGIIFAHLMGGTISGKVMLLTPAFRNMNVALEEAARVSGASNIKTLMRVTLPVMIPPMAVVFMLNVVRIFSSFEVEQILGRPFHFFVFSTKIYQFVREFDPPQYGSATALASITLVLIAVIIPVQRWLLSRRQYTTVSGQFKPGLIDLGKYRWVVFGALAALLAMLVVIPALTLIGGSIMTRVGFFQSEPTYTIEHWRQVWISPVFVKALRTTLILAFSTAIVSPIIFSVIAYILVRTQWRGRIVLDSFFWMSAAIPGMLSSLGLLWLFLRTPGFIALYGTIWALILVVILQGKLTSTQLLKSVYLQVGADMEEAARVSGAGWVYTYFKIWLPLIMPTIILIGTINFVIAAQTTSSIILLASRDTITLSILALELMSSSGADYERAGIVSIILIVMTVGVAIVARRFGLRLGVQHH
ncbi:MAG: iron ABC transporter permease [Chloroflexi bacterium]|nr:iron ABC transporter permease [Chloroflexota bacterium]